MLMMREVPILGHQSTPISTESPDASGQRAQVELTDGSGPAAPATARKAILAIVAAG